MPGMASLSHGQALPEAAVIAVEEDAASLRKMGGKALGHLLAPSWPCRRAPASPMIGGEEGLGGIEAHGLEGARVVVGRLF